MADLSEVEQIVEKVVSQVLENHVPQLREELVRRVLEDLPPAAGASGDGAAANLLKAVSAIHAGTTQREILRALLDNTVRYSGRGALFVVKAGAATGWQGRGFTQDGEDTIKDFALNVGLGAPEQALEKVAALVYADAGREAGGKMDAAALELLVRATSAWLEVASLRKQAQKEESAEATAERTESAAPSHATPGHATSVPSDPFAAHAPKHITSVPEAIPTPPVMAKQPVAVAQAEPIVASAAAAAPAPAADPFANMSPEDADVHRKAQRFARLLVDEIKLYNQAKVAEGRKNKDLYDRLKEDIEKSRGTFQKRYGNSAAAGADYFSQEIVRSLAEDDASIMGANFRRN